MSCDDWAAPQPTLKDQLTIAPYWLALSFALVLVMEVMHFSNFYSGRVSIGYNFQKLLNATYSHVLGKEFLAIGFRQWDGESGVSALGVRAEMSIADCWVASGIGIYHRFVSIPKHLSSHKELLTDVGDESLKFSNQVDSSLVGLWWSTATRAPTGALGSHIAAGASLDIIIGNVAAIAGLIPDSIAVHTSTSSLASYLDLGAFGIGFLYSVACTWSRAAVDTVAGNGIGTCNGSCQSSRGEEGELHCE